MEDNKQTPDSPTPKTPPSQKSSEEGGESPPSRGLNPILVMAMMLLVAMMVVFYAANNNSRVTVPYDYFKSQVNAQEVLQIQVGEWSAQGVFKKDLIAPPKYDPETKKLVFDEDKNGNPKKLASREFYVTLPRSDQERSNLLTLLERSDVQVINSPPSDNAFLLTLAVYLLLPIGLFIFLWFMFRRTRDQIMGGGFLSGFNKNPAKRYEGNRQPVTFEDVAGLEGVKADLQEVIGFLKDPEKFQRLGGRVPKGVLLLGPPGTGKTLLARAVAGEANVPFFSVNGSEFIQMFVGVGASRVRDLFKEAKDASPSIVFIDEIDAVGRQRGAGLGGGHDEREQTLNQILGEMDGFAPNEAVIVMAATNRPDVLDPALLRPGRFDRHITVDRPTRKGRVEIFGVHVRNVPLDNDVDLERLAAGTVGMTGADIRNLVNEAALWAARQDKKRVQMDDFEHARDKILMGPTREDVLVGEEKSKTAYHEAGHALVAWLVSGADRVHKVTVIPRGRALGVTQTLPEEDKMNISESELRDRLAFMLGGREAERLVYDESSAGAENDLERATSLARRMVTRWGMSARLGPVSYKLTSEDPFLGREMHEARQFSEHTMQIIDEEISSILHKASEKARQLLVENRDKLNKLANGLLQTEELDEKEIAVLIGPSVHQLAEEAISESQAQEEDAPKEPGIEEQADLPSTDG